MREDRVLAHVVDQLRVTGEWTDGLADPRKLVAHLWRHHITITCGSTRLEINTSEEPGLIQPALFGL